MARINVFTSPIDGTSVVRAPGGEETLERGAVLGGRGWWEDAAS
jgi:hypothetical protein